MAKFEGKTVKFVEGTASKLEVPEGKFTKKGKPILDAQLFDSVLRGFGMRRFAPSKAFPKGKCSYFVKFTVKGETKQRRVTLGEVIDGNLKAMRQRADEILSAAKLGRDIVGDARAAADAAANTVTLGQIVPKYLKARESELRDKSYVEVTRYLEKSWKPLHPLAINAITRQNIVTVVDDIERDSGKVSADRARTSLSALFGWCIDRGHLETNPTMNVRARAQGGGRTRLLSEPELREIWVACEDVGEFGAIVRLLILTGQRRTEISDLRWSEIHLEERQIKLSPARCKNGKSMVKHKIACHIVPLSDQALEILQAIPRGERTMVFGRGAGGFGSFSYCKTILDARIAARTGKTLDKWVIHEIRHAVTTHLAESRRGPPGQKPYSLCAPHICEAITNHLSGHKAGIGGRYNHATYLEEKREALEKWGRHVLGLVNGSNVIPLTRQQKAGA